MSDAANDLTDEEVGFMDKAFSYAYEALAEKEVPVGCILVYNNEIRGVGRNTVNETKNATRHAELNCIDQLYEYCTSNSLDHKKVFSETSVYVTVEPCIMCAAALYDLGIKNVVYGCKNDRFGGQTVFNVAQVLNTRTVVKGGHRSEEALNLLKEFYDGVNPNAPPSKVKVRGKKC